MAEASRSRVTISLGRSGQVVKRPGLVNEESSVSYSQPSAGSKRSMRDRLGGYADPIVPLNNKRQVRDGSRLSLSVSDDLDDVTLTKDDLRFKIMRKSSSQTGIQQKGVDLRDLLSRPAHSSTHTRKNMPRDQVPEPMHVRPQMPMPIPKNNERQLMTERGDGRPKQPAPRDSNHRMPEYESTRHPGHVLNGSSSFAQVRPSSSTKPFHDMDSLRRGYSPWTLDSLRRRSPDKLLRTSRGISPRRRNEEPDGRPLSRSYDDSRASSYVSKCALDHPNPINPLAYAVNAAQTAVAAKRMLPPTTPLPLSAASVQRSSYAVDQYSVDAFLHSLGLEKYSINFKAEEVDMFALRRMGDSDLKDLGIPMGPRKKILLTLLSQAKRQLL